MPTPADRHQFTMSQRVKRNVMYLKVLAKAKPKMCKCIIEAADKDLVATLCECAQNILYGHVPLTPSQKTKLAWHKQHLRSLVKKNQSEKTKKKILQKGGFLGALLGPLAVSLIAPIAKQVIDQVVPR